MKNSRRLLTSFAACSTYIVAAVVPAHAAGTTVVPLDDHAHGSSMSSATFPVDHDGSVHPSECGPNPTGDVAWHFVLSMLDADTPLGTLSASFDDSGTKTATGQSLPGNADKRQEFYVYTDGDDSLLDATATVDEQSDSPKLVLANVAHECVVAEEDSGDTTGSGDTSGDGVEGSDTTGGDATGGDTGETIDGSSGESGDAGDSADTGDSVDSGDSADTGDDVIDAGDTGDTSGTGDAGDELGGSGDDPVDGGDVVDAGEAIESGDTGQEAGDTGDEVVDSGEPDQGTIDGETGSTDVEESSDVEDASDAEDSNVVDDAGSVDETDTVFEASGSTGGLDAGRLDVLAERAEFGALATTGSDTTNMSLVGMLLLLTGAALRRTPFRSFERRRR